MGIEIDYAVVRCVACVVRPAFLAVLCVCEHIFIIVHIAVVVDVVECYRQGECSTYNITYIADYL